MHLPAIQNDFSFYRRTVNRLRTLQKARCSLLFLKFVCIRTNGRICKRARALCWLPDARCCRSDAWRSRLLISFSEAINKFVGHWSSCKCCSLRLELKRPPRRGLGLSEGARLGGSASDHYCLALSLTPCPFLETPCPDVRFSCNTTRSMYPYAKYIRT